MNEKKTNTGLVVILVILIMLMLGVGTLVILSKMGYVSFGKDNELNLEEDNGNNNSLVSNRQAELLMKDLFLVTNDYFSSANTYCGKYGSEKIMPEDGRVSNGFYKSDTFNSYQELKNYLLKYISNDIVDNRFKDSYIEKNGSLYCEDLGKGGNMQYYLFVSLDVEIDSVKINEIIGTIKALYLDYDGNETIKIVDMTLIKKSENWVIGSYVLK